MKKILLSLFVLSSFVLFQQTILAQTGVKGVIMDSQTGETLIGATVVLQGTNTGTATDTEGKFLLEGPAGSYTLDITYVGYDNYEMGITIEEGKITNLGNLKIEASAIGLAGISIIADRARERETPVAFSTISKKQLQEQLGSRDIPLAMDITPNVYATMQGGGAGDARINVRGFNQRNVAIMINGVPVNDMENGWVYWSNWDGVGDATSSIQMQRGLSAVNLATPSIGGTMNVITNPADQKAGITYKQEFGSGAFSKSTLFAHSGLIKGKYAISAGGVRKVGQGVIDRTWTDAWAYYLGASWNINKNHRLEFYANGAPQRHGQNLYRQNIAAYSHDYAKNEFDYPQEALDEYPEAVTAGSQATHRLYGDQYSGRLYNENWGPVDYTYKGQQSWNGGYHTRYSPDFINERENYYHKPIANLNWFAQFSDKVSLFTTGYYSGGKGGGTGTYGSIKWDYSGPSRTADWNSTIENNETIEEWSYKEIYTDMNGEDSTVYNSQPLGDKQAVGILRNSVNNQWTIGLISKLRWELSEKFKMSFGIDGRTAGIEHHRTVRDLLGGNYFSPYDADGNRLIDKIDYTSNPAGNVSYEFPVSQFWSNSQYNRKLGDKVDYDFSNTVNWLGGYAQGEYNYGNITAYGTLGYSMIKYTYTNHFVKESGTDNELKAESDWISGYQAKGGFSYRFTETVSAYANLGYVSKVPIFDAVINDRDGTVAQDPENEKFSSIELGVTYKTYNNKFLVTGNLYYTTWKDRTLSRGIQLEDGSEGFIFITGMSQEHKGLEIEGKYRPFKSLGFIFAGSLNDWKYTNNVTGEYKDYANPDDPEEYGYYVDGLKVGDAPQTQGILGIDVYPVERWKIQLLMKHYSNYYADWDPFTRTDETDTGQVWKTPGYTTFDLHTDYTFPLNDQFRLNVFLHVFNLFDEMYIQDATDNSPYNGYYGPNNEYSHQAPAAEVFLGMPRVFNFGIILSM